MLRRAFACVVALCAACSFDFDAAGPHGGGATDGGGPAGAGNPSGGDAAGGPPEGGAPVNDCSENGGDCVPLPTGFQGAALLGVGCGEAAKVFDGHSSYSFEPATCGCSCITTASTCTLPGAAQALGSPLCAANGTVTHLFLTDGCIELPADPDAVSIQLIGEAEPPSCITNGGDPIKPPIEWMTPIVGCGFQSLGCGDDICLPGPEQRYCFYRALGDAPVECPAGLVDTPVFQKADVGDSRDCECNCGGKDVDDCANPMWSFYDDIACTLGSGSALSICGGFEAETESVSVTVASEVVCTQSAAPPTGTVVVVPTVQACCSPP